MEIAHAYQLLLQLEDLCDKVETFERHSGENEHCPICKAIAKSRELITRLRHEG